MGKEGASAGYQLSAALSGSDGTSQGQTNTNAQVGAGETLTVKSGQDTTIAGANLGGKDIKMDVGRDLTVASLQDTASSSSSSYNVGATVTLGPAPGVVKDALPGDPAKVGTTGNSGSLGGGSGSSSSAWVSGQTSIIGSNSVEIRTEKNTAVEGAVIAAENGNLKLDTGTLTYKDLQDKDTGSNTQVGVTVPLGSALGSAASSASSSSPVTDFLMGSTLSGSYDSHDKRQVNRATIGEGTIIIRSDPAQGLAGLNRDLQKAQELTKDSKTSVTVYIDPAAIKEAAGGFEGVTDSFKALVKLVKEGKASADIVDSLENQLSTRDKLIRTGMSAKDADAVIEQNAFAAVIQGALEKKIAEKGGLENLTEAEAQEIVDSLTMTPDLKVKLAGSLTGISFMSGHTAVGVLPGFLQAAGLDAKSVLSYMNDMSGYVLWSASGGLAFKEQAQQFSKTNAEFANGVGCILSNPKVAASVAGEKLQAKLNEYNTAIAQGNPYHVGELLGQLLYQAAMLAISVPGVAKAVLAKVASVSPGVAAAIEAGEAGEAWKGGLTGGASKTGEAAKGGVGVIKGALPNAENAVIDVNKVTGYALNSTHPVGANKAVVFDAALGYNQSNAGELIAKVQEGVRTNPAVLGKADQFGQRFAVDMPITGPNGKTVTVRTGWILDPGSTTPRLTTLYVK